MDQIFTAAVAMFRYLASVGHGWPVFIVVGWVGLAIAGGLAWATAGWKSDQQIADEDAFDRAVALGPLEPFSLRSFEQRAAKGFTAGFTNDHHANVIPMSSRKVH